MQHGNQKLSKYVIAIVGVVWLIAAVCFFIALPNHSWLWLISIFKQVFIYFTHMYLYLLENHPTLFLHCHFLKLWL